MSHQLKHSMLLHGGPQWKSRMSQWQGSQQWHPSGCKTVLHVCTLHCFCCPFWDPWWSGHCLETHHWMTHMCHWRKHPMEGWEWKKKSQGQQSAQCLFAKCCLLHPWRGWWGHQQWPQDECGKEKHTGMAQRGVEKDGVACGRPKHTNHCVCGEKGGEKGFWESVLWKRHSQNQNTKTKPPFQQFLYKPLTKKWNTVDSPLSANSSKCQIEKKPLTANCQKILAGHRTLY